MPSQYPLLHPGASLTAAAALEVSNGNSWTGMGQWEKMWS